MDNLLSVLLALYLISVGVNILGHIICLITIDNFDKYGKFSICFLGPIATVTYLFFLFLGGLIDLIYCAKGIWFNRK